MSGGVSKQLTRSSVKAMKPAEQAAAYFADNTAMYVTNDRPGPSLRAQEAFWNDWQEALDTWKATLPRDRFSV